MDTTAFLPAGDGAAPALDQQQAAEDLLLETTDAAPSGDDTAKPAEDDHMPFDEEAAIAEMMAAPAAEKLAKNYRITARNDLDAQILAMHRRNPDMSLAEATARVTGRSQAPGEGASSQNQHQDAPAEEALTAFETRNRDTQHVSPVTELEAVKGDLLRQLKEANNALDFERVADIQAELAELPFQIHQAKEAERGAAAARQHEMLQAVAAAEAKAIDLYPDAVVEGSDLYQEIVDLYAELEAHGDRLIERADCGLIITQMAAARLGIPPAKKGQRHPPSADAEHYPEPNRAPENPVRPRPVSGRGAAPNASQEAAAERWLNSLSLDQLEELANRVK